MRFIYHRAWQIVQHWNIKLEKGPIHLLYCISWIKKNERNFSEIFQNSLVLLKSIGKTVKSVWFCLIFQSINQSNFYCTNIHGEARLSGSTAESVFNSKIYETVS